MNYSHQRLSLGVVGILLLISASCGGTGENEQRDRPVHDDPTKPLRTAITGKVIAECLGHEDVVSGVAVSPDGKLVVSTSDDRTLRYWSVPDGKLIRTIHPAKPGRDPSYIMSPHFFADGKTVAALVYTRNHRKLCFWDSATGKELPRSVTAEGGWVLALSPDGERLASRTDSVSVRVCDTREGRLLREFRFGKEEGIGDALAYSFSPDGNHLAVGLIDRGLSSGDLPVLGGAERQSVSSKVRVWDLRTGQLAFTSETLPLDREARRDLGPNGERELVPEKQPYDAKAVAFSPDGTRLAAGGQDYYRGEDFDTGNSIWVWDLATRKLVQKLPVGEPDVAGLAFSPDGHMLACAAGTTEKCHDSVIQVWNVTSGKLLGSLQKHTDTVTAVAWVKDGRTLVSCGRDRRLMIWRLEPH